MNPRKTAVGLWAGLAALVTLAGTGTAAAPDAGLFSATACISPAVLLVLALTPAETLVTVGTHWAKKRAGMEPKKGQQNETGGE